MARSLLVSVVVAMSLAGCVGIAPGTLAPVTSQPSTPSVTAAPATNPPSVSPTATPPAATTTTAPVTAPPATAAPTAAPTAPATATGEPASPGPSAGVIEDFGADTPLFNDDFNDDTSGWGTGTTAGGTVAYVDDALEFDTAAAGAWMWSRRTADTSSNVMHVEGDFTPSALGYQGLLCSDNDDELWGMVANAAGLWVAMSLGANGASILTSSQDPAFEMTPNETTHLALDCAGTNAGGFRMQLSLPEAGVAVLYEGAAGEGPAVFDRAGIYAEAAADPYSLRVDNVSAFGGT